MARDHKFMFTLRAGEEYRTRAIFAPDEETAREWFILRPEETIVSVREAGTR